MLYHSYLPLCVKRASVSCGTSVPSGIWRMNPAPYFPFFCVARRLKYPVFRPPRALRKEKHVSWIDTPTTGRGTSDHYSIFFLLFLNATGPKNYPVFPLKAFVLNLRFYAPQNSRCRAYCVLKEGLLFVPLSQR